MRGELDKVRLTLSRLNDMWSFTGNPLSYQVDLFLRVRPADDCENILYAIRGYGCLASAAGHYIEQGVNPSDEWSRLFRECGQRLMFDLPDELRKLDRIKFEKNVSQCFVFGYKGGESPSPQQHGAGVRNVCLLSS